MKKGFIIICSFLIIVLVELLFFLLPSLIGNKDVKNLKKEVNMVSNYIYKSKGNINEIKKYIDSDITSGKRIDLEKAVDSYLNDILNAFYGNNELDNDIISDNVIVDFNKDDIQTKYDTINNYISILNNSKSLFTDIDLYNYYKTNDKDLMNLYIEIVSNFDKNNIMNNINIYLSNLDDKYKIFEFLNNNKDYYDIDNKIIFNKRSKFNEFSSLLDNIDVKISYELVKDTVGPIINANNISITEGDYVSLNDRISCIDEVDGNVTCNFSGSYNNTIPGVYKIDIKATDSSNNETNKSINIIVKEREKYNLPYVIHVIRNQSTTLVYGQDENGEYTNLIGVFPCSPGAGSNTPVGTFYSKRGYPWGGLFGGVYGQYSTIITGHVLFHSVPYNSMNKDDLIWKYYNRLGSKDSLGCVRLTVRDAKWIYDNCPNGTMIKIYDGDLPSGVSKPEAPKIDPNDEKRGWDPTDPDPANPWNQ